MTDRIWMNIVDDEPDQLLDFVRNPNQAPSRDRLLDVAHNCGCELADLALIKMIRGAGSMSVPSKP